ncbi:pollen-specific leucine-rich repeat extensin-like protein 2 isoform X3 [Hordeum vulgare subsp. vulgare]|uniref:pollen-specific leucine-rich repeat extensin-like protein 2 isoform X3 n=1 Tax=Hordeum vulgare subsp. vulgare TaxID=112509 RepID=UPI001D1A5304|nr:pollen-specific leucine-rich repeat extensin-like protein 2 isoform X3 [Hordeum vulgare subsp. vulgare]
MDAYHHQQRRFDGSGDAPPPQPPPPSHWYPSPAPPYHPPHPNHPYPPQHHQWGHPPPDLQHQHRPPPPQYAYQAPPPPMQQQMQPPPPAPGNPWPPHHAAAQPPPQSYPPPPPGQAWPNHSWAQNHGYPGNGNAMLQYPSPRAQPSLSASSVQDGFPRGPPGVPGHGVPSYRIMADPSDQPLEFNDRKAPDMAVHETINIRSTAPTAVSEHGTVPTSTQSWGPSATVGYFHPAPVPPQASQMDPSLHGGPLFGALSGSNYVPPAAFGVGSVTEAFPTDANTLFNVAERSKKPPVPNWLREELLKKKSTPVSASVQRSTNYDSMESEDAAEPPKRADQNDSRSIGSAKSIVADEADEDEVEAARTAAINKEIKRVLTEVLLKVTDDLFNEIATKVMNEDNLSAEPNETTGVSSSKELGLGESKVKTTAKVVVPAKPNSVSSTGRSDGIGLSSPKGALLGLASYDSDDEDDDGDGDGKGLISNLSSEIKVGAALPKESEKNIDGALHNNSNGSIASLQSVSSGDDHKSSDERSQSRPTAESEREPSIHDTQNGEAKTSIQPIGVIHKTNEKAHGHAEVDFQNGKTSSVHHTENNNNNAESTHRHFERKSHEKDLKEPKVVNGIDSEPSRTDKFRDGDKHSMPENTDKKGTYKEEKGSDRYAKHGLDRWDDAKRDRKDLPKDASERKRDSADRRDIAKDGNDDRSRQITKSSASHSSRRSRSPNGRSRTRNESSSRVRGSISSDEPSDNAKRRKSHSRKNSMSPSPPKSRSRRVSRSPPSKHSHRRHSPYSSAERKKRSRSRTPVKRR